jgi:hypothetical protein
MGTIAWNMGEKRVLFIFLFMELQYGQVKDFHVWEMVIHFSD